MFAFSAAGFIATSTFGASPGVRMSWSAKCSWNDDTPGSVPAGARISAGKFGSVDRSFPNDAVSEVNRSPVSCIPSPESPANLITTRSSRRTSLSTAPATAGAVVSTDMSVWAPVVAGPLGAGQARHWGWLPCLREGRATCLVRSTASASISRTRVSAGSMTSSTRPRSAA
ncbi:hypothetical protein LRR80_04703 [Streptomyces sp. RO-S4]|nr:hypothetical protein [Streptomyces sp. RO-S4]